MTILELAIWLLCCIPFFLSFPPFFFFLWSHLVDYTSQGAACISFILFLYHSPALPSNQSQVLERKWKEEDSPGALSVTAVTGGRYQPEPPQCSASEQGCVPASSLSSQARCRRRAWERSKQANKWKQCVGSQCTHTYLCGG